MPLWRSRPNTRTLPAILLTPPPSKAADMAHLRPPQSQALGVCKGFVPDIQVCGTHQRKDLVNTTIISNAEEEEAEGTMVSRISLSHRHGHIHIHTHSHTQCFRGEEPNLAICFLCCMVHDLLDLVWKEEMLQYFTDWRWPVVVEALCLYMTTDSADLTSNILMAVSQYWGFLTRMVYLKHDI